VGTARALFARLGFPVLITVTIGGAIASFGSGQPPAVAIGPWVALAYLVLGAGERVFPLHESWLRRQQDLGTDVGLFLTNTVVEEILAQEENRKIRALSLRNVVTDETSEMPIDGCFMAIDHKPNTDIFKGQLEMEDTGYLKVQPGSTRTSVEGVFAAGDVADHVYRQAITAAGTGCMAALDAERWLAQQG